MGDRMVAVVLLVACGPPPLEPPEPAPPPLVALPPPTPPPAPVLAPALDGDRFRLECLRACRLHADGRTWPVQRGWFDMVLGDAAEVHGEDYDVATSVAVGDGRTLVHLFAYDIMESGSMHGAGGMDVFLLVDRETVERVATTGEATMHRSRGMGRSYAEASTYLVADVDGDGLVDLGRIRETIAPPGPPVDDILPPEVFRQEPVVWATAARGFVPGKAHAGVLPEAVAVVPRPIEMTAIEYIAGRVWPDGPWLTDGVVAWDPPPRPRPPPKVRATRP